MIGIFKKGEMWTQTQTCTMVRWCKTNMWQQRGRDWSNDMQAKNCWPPPEVGWDTERRILLPCRVSKGIWPCSHLEFRFLKSPELWDIHFCFVKHSVCFLAKDGVSLISVLGFLLFWIFLFSSCHPINYSAYNYHLYWEKYLYDIQVFYCSRFVLEVHYLTCAPCTPHSMHASLLPKD